MAIANPTLLLTKLGIPPLHPNTISRPSLLSPPAVHPGTRLVLVLGPAGFGKTTLLAGWCHALVGQDGSCVGWYSLDERDDDPLRFLSHLIASLSIAMGERADLQPARQALYGGEAEDHEHLLTLLLNAIARAPGNCLLVLDDYHLISAPAIHASIAFILEHAPAQMTLALGSRSDPPLQLSRLRARGQLLELRAADIRFTREETGGFLRRALGRELRDEDVAALHDYTEGWPAGLQLAAVALKQRAAGSGSTDLRQWLTSLSVPRRNVLEYLADEVFEQQSPSVRDFLLETSVLDRLTPALCDEITGRQDAAAVLGELEQAGLFLVPLDEERRWYRYHQAFREFLRERLGRDLPDRIDELLRDASRWHEWEGMTGESLHYAMAARDYERAARLIETSAEGMWLRNEVDTLLKWIAALPEEVVAVRPSLALFGALALLHKQRTEEAERHLGLAGRVLDGTRDASGDTRAPGRNGGESTGEERGMLAALRSISAVIQGSASDGEDQAIEALRCLPADRLSWRAVALVGLGVARGLAGDAAGAERTLAEAKAVSRAAGAMSMSFIAEHNLAALQLLRGRLREGARSCRDLLSLAEENGSRRLHHVSETQVELGSVLYEWNDLDGALREAMDALDLAHQTRQESTMAAAYQLLARIRQGRGDTAGALEAVEQARRLAEEKGVSAAAASAAAQQAQIWLAQGDLESASRWARAVEETDGRIDASPPLHQFTTEPVSLTRVWIAQGRCDEADELIRDLLAAAEARGWIGRVVEALVLRAMSYHARGDDAEAVAAIERALGLAEAEGFTRIFLDEGAPVISLLRQVASRRSGLHYARRLLALVDGQPNERTWASTSQDLVDPLSGRELEVLRLVAEGATNQEIADALVITLGTVKIHVNHILSKLGARNRTEATVRARELALL